MSTAITILKHPNPTDTWKQSVSMATNIENKFKELSNHYSCTVWVNKIFNF